MTYYHTDLKPKEKLKSFLIGSVFSSYILTCLLAIVAFFTPLKLILITTFVLVVIDMLVKVVAQMIEKKNNELPFIKRLISNFRVIQSNKIRRTIWKLTAYCTVICLFFLVEMTIFGRSIYVNNGIAGIIFTTELISICASLDKTMKGNIFTRLISNFQKTITNGIEDKIKKEIENKDNV